MGNPRRHRKSNFKKCLKFMSLIDLKGFRSKAFPTCLPVSISIQHVGTTRPGGTPRRGFIGQYHFSVEQIIPMTGKSSWILEGWLRYPSEAWPYETLKRGLPRLPAKGMKNWEWVSRIVVLTCQCGVYKLYLYFT